MPTTSQDLADHKFVLYNWLHKPTSITLKHGEIEHKVHMSSNFSANNLGAIMNVIRKGGGLHCAPKWYLHKEGENTEFIEVLEDWAKTGFPAQCFICRPFN